MGTEKHKSYWLFQHSIREKELLEHKQPSPLFPKPEKRA